MINRGGERIHEGYTLNRKTTGAIKASSLAYQEARARANIYRFLSAIYLNPPHQGFLDQISKKDFLEELSSLFGGKGVADLKEFATIARFGEDLAALKQEYMDLFAVPAGRYVTPFEDVYQGRAVDSKQKGGPLLGTRAIAVIRMYREAGGEMDGGCKELPTHIGVELSFMNFLCEREASAVGNEKRDTRLDRAKTKGSDSIKYRKLRMRFLQEHLNEWFPRLSQSIQANTKTRFYRGLALITEEFLAWDTADLMIQLDLERGYAANTHRTSMSPQEG